MNPGYQLIWLISSMYFHMYQIIYNILANILVACKPVVMFVYGDEVLSIELISVLHLELLSVVLSVFEYNDDKVSGIIQVFALLPKETSLIFPSQKFEIFCSIPH